MSKSELKDALQEFQQTLARTQDLGEDERAELVSAVESIHDDLAQDSEIGATGSIVGRLRAAIEGFEDRHPRLTEVVGRVADSLSEMGI
jgi:hypothetical protein